MLRWSVGKCWWGWFQQVAEGGIAASEVVERIGLKEGVETTQRKHRYVHEEDKEDDEKENASNEHHEAAWVSCGAQGEPARDPNESEGDGAKKFGDNDGDLHGYDSGGGKNYLESDEEREGTGFGCDETGEAAEAFADGCVLKCNGGKDEVSKQ